MLRIVSCYLSEEYAVTTGDLWARTIVIGKNDQFVCGERINWFEKRMMCFNLIINHLPFGRYFCISFIPNAMDKKYDEKKLQLSMNKLINIEFNGYLITTNKEAMQPASIHRWLSQEAYWCKNIPFETVKTAFDHSFCIGILKDDQQIGYARLITDYAVFAYLADVYVEPAHRGIGLSKKMMEILINLDWVKKLRGIKLATQDAHSLYKQFGFGPLAHPETMMEISRPKIYSDTNIIQVGC